MFRDHGYGCDHGRDEKMKMCGVSGRCEECQDSDRVCVVCVGTRVGWASEGTSGEGGNGRGRGRESEKQGRGIRPAPPEPDVTSTSNVASYSS